MIWIKLYCNSDISFIELDGSSKSFCQSLNCRYISYLSLKKFLGWTFPAYMIIDDHGYESKKAINFTANSIFYPHYYSGPIAGDVLVGLLNDNYDYVGFADEDAAFCFLDFFLSYLRKKTYFLCIKLLTYNIYTRQLRCRVGNARGTLAGCLKRAAPSL